MRVRLVKKQSIEDYVAVNSPGRASFKTWLALVKQADWNKPGDIKSTFGSADLLGKGSNRVVFNIGGNRYRMICEYFFGKKKVHLFVKWIGTHGQYDELCRAGRQYTESMY